MRILPSSDRKYWELAKHVLKLELGNVRVVSSAIFGRLLLLQTSLDIIMSSLKNSALPGLKSHSYNLEKLAGILLEGGFHCLSVI